MPASNSPKKRALMPSSPLRRKLRAAGHHLSPIVQVGKEGVTEAVARQLDRALLDHELVKVKVGTETPEDRFGTADQLLEASGGAALAQILGRTLLLYRRHPKKPRYEPLPPGAEARAPARAARPPRSPPREPSRTPSRGPFRGSSRPSSREADSGSSRGFSRGAPRGASRASPRGGPRGSSSRGSRGPSGGSSRGSFRGSPRGSRPRRGQD